MNLYISDLHFGHKNVIKFDDRPFDNVDQIKIIKNEDNTIFVHAGIDEEAGEEWG